MRLLLMSIVFIAGCSWTQGKDGDYRIYEISDMEDLLWDYYANNLKRVSPGIACGNFKTGNDVGCFKLLVRKEDGKLTSLIYDEPTNGKLEKVYEFNSSANFVFIEKIYKDKLENSASLPKHKEVKLAKDQPALRLVFFEKSSVVFYWRDGKFNEIWTSD